MEVDNNLEVNENLSQCEELMKKGQLNEALENLFVLEKQARTAADAHLAARVLVTVIRSCFQAEKWNMLNENIVVLAKRRNQPKQAVTKMVQEACTFVNQMPSKEIKLKFIEVLRQVTDGKMYVEVERARLTRILSQMKEDEGNIDDAAQLLQELQVETYGSMERREKVEFILEQMRLGLARKDFVRTQIISKKISPKFFANNDTQDLKLKFYELSVRLCETDSAYATICQYYTAVYDTPIIKESEDKLKEVLQKMILYAVLAPLDNDRTQMIHRIKQDKNMEKIPKYRELLDCFTTQEIILWDTIVSTFRDELVKGSTETPSTGLFDLQSEAGQRRWADFKKRVVEHNIYVIAKYYTTIKLQRLAELLHLEIKDAEEFISSLVISKTIYAKIDRPTGIVHFVKKCKSDVALNDWSDNTRNLMRLINKSTYLINREEMLNKTKNLSNTVE